MQRITRFDLDNWFTYRSPSEEQLQKYSSIRTAAQYFATVILSNTPQGPDQTAAIRKIRESVMTANAAIACECGYKAISDFKNQMEARPADTAEPGGAGVERPPRNTGRW